METIEIKVSEYYDNHKYYAVMPEIIFDALEAAFLNGCEVATVPKSAFDGMIKEFEK
jgi:hypothetical protein